MNMQKWLIGIMLLLLFSGCSQNTENLIEDLQSDNASTRRRAATTLIQGRGGPEAVQSLIGLLDNENPRTVFLATQILGALADTSAVKPLGKMVDNPNEHIRARAVLSLGTIGHEDAFPYIEKALQDSVPYVRHSAVKALGYLHYVPAANDIFPMFHDEVDSIRAAAVYSLYLYRLDPEAEIRAADFAVPLADESELVRYVTVQALGYAFPDSTVAGDMLIDALKDQSKNVRLEAILSIGKLKYEKAIPYLKDMYDFASIDEELAISETIEQISGEVFPPMDEEEGDAAQSD